MTDSQEAELGSREAGSAGADGAGSALATRTLSTGSEWNFELIGTYDRAIREIAVGEFGLDCYPNQIEVIASEQMLDAHVQIAPKYPGAASAALDHEEPATK